MDTVAQEHKQNGATVNQTADEKSKHSRDTLSVGGCELNSRFLLVRPCMTHQPRCSYPLMRLNRRL